MTFEQKAPRQAAALPAQPLPKSNARPNLLAMLLTVKYVDGLPSARFEKVLDRYGAHIPRQTQIQPDAVTYDFIGNPCPG